MSVLFLVVLSISGAVAAGYLIPITGVTTTLVAGAVCSVVAAVIFGRAQTAASGALLTIRTPARWMKAHATELNIAAAALAALAAVGSCVTAAR